MAMNPWDEYAAEEAVQLGERLAPDPSPSAMGTTAATDALSHTLAIGINEAMLVDSTGMPVDIGATTAILPPQFSRMAILT